MAERVTQAQRTKFDQIEWGEAAMQESAFGTPLATGDINVNYPRNTDLLFVDRNPVTVGEDETGYGDEWPRNDYINRNELKIDGIGYRMSSQMAMLIVALGLGKVQTVDNEDTSFEHTFTPWDLKVAKAAGNAGFSQPPHTSLRYKEGPNQYIAHSICMNSFEIAGAPESFPNITVNVVGSGEETVNADAFQSVAVPSLLKLVKVEVAAAAADDISKAVRDVTFGWNNNLAVDEAYTPSAEAAGGFRSQLFAGQREYTLGINFDQHSTDAERASSLAQTAEKVILTYEGSVIAGVNKHHMIITCHRVRIGTRGQSDSNNRKVNDIEYKARADGSGDFLTIVVQNDVTDTVLAIAA